MPNKAHPPSFTRYAALPLNTLAYNADNVHVFAQIIISQVVLFSCFGITQFVLLWRVDGPSVYFWGTCSPC